MSLNQRISGRTFWITSIACLLLGTATVAVYASSSDHGRSRDDDDRGRSPISWVSSSITETASAGAITSATIAFTSNKNLSNVCLKVSKRLRDLVDVSPATFPALSKGQMMQVSVNIHPPATFPSGTVEGFIYARATTTRDFEKKCDRDEDDDFSKAIGARLPVVLNVVWAKFTDPQTGVQLSYPDLGVPSKVDSTPSSSGATRLNVSFLSADGLNYINGFGIFMYQNPSGLSLQDWFHQQIDQNGVLISSGVFTETKLSNGMSVLVISGPLPSDFGPVMSAYSISKSGKTIIAIGQSEDNQLGALGLTQSQIDQMLLLVLANLQSP